MRSCWKKTYTHTHTNKKAKVIAIKLLLLYSIAIVLFLPFFFYNITSGIFVVMCKKGSEEKYALVNRRPLFLSLFLFSSSSSAVAIKRRITPWVVVCHRRRRPPPPLQPQAAGLWHRARRQRQPVSPRSTTGLIWSLSWPQRSSSAPFAIGWLRITKSTRSPRPLRGTILFGSKNTDLVGGRLKTK